MASTLTLYEHLTEVIADGTLDLDSGTFKLALVTSSYTPSAADDTDFDTDVSSSEVANGSGYTTGGATLASVSVSRTGSTTTWDAADVTFTSLTKTFRYGVIYESTSGALIAYILFDDSPADVTVTSTDYNVIWSSSGILQLSM